MNVIETQQAVTLMRNIYYPNAKARRKGEVIAWSILIVIMMSVAIGVMLSHV